MRAKCGTAHLSIQAEGQPRSETIKHYARLQAVSSEDEAMIANLCIAAAVPNALFRLKQYEDSTVEFSIELSVSGIDAKEPNDA